MSSIKILLPSHNPNKDVKASLDPVREKQQEEELLLLSREFVSAIFDGPLPSLLEFKSDPIGARIAQDWRATHDVRPTAMKLDEYLGFMKATFKKYPRYETEILNEAADIEPYGGKAMVFQLVRNTGIPIEGVKEDGVRVFNWRRTWKGEWVMYRYAVFRHTGDFVAASVVVDSR